MDWNDPAARARLIEEVGPDEYSRRLQEHRKKSTLATVNGHEIRLVTSDRFGPLYAVGKTGMAFASLVQAKRYAAEHKAS